MQVTRFPDLRENTFICGRGVSEQVNYDFAALRGPKQWVYNIISKQHFRLDRVLMGKLRRNCQTQVAVKILDITHLSGRFSRAVSKAKDVEKEVNIMLQINH
ncbi:hypothetical protein ANCDUO_26015, partial [Ancylostoma duodenale]